MTQETREKTVKESFQNGTGKHLTFYQCVVDAVENGGTIEDVAALVKASKTGERNFVLNLMDVIGNV